MAAILKTKKCKSVYCDRESVARDMCSKHHKRFMKGQDINIKTLKELSVKERFFNSIVKNEITGCWIWIGNRRGNKPLEYGIICENWKSYSAHRFSWVLHNGEIPKGGDYRGLCVCHKCDNTLCVNPEHLFLGTHTQNMRDKTEKNRHPGKAKTKCKRGHPFTEENIYRCKNGLRHCRQCKKEKYKAEKALKPKRVINFINCCFFDCKNLTKNKHGLCKKHYKLQANRMYSGLRKHILEKPFYQPKET